MILKYVIAFVSAISVMLIGVATTTPSETPETSLLWKIEGKGMTKPSYLFGTMHLIQKKYFYFPNSLRKLIAKSSEIYTEVDLDELGDQQKAMKLLMLPEDESIMDYFGTAQQDTLLKWVEQKFHLNKEAFTATMGKFKPFVLVQMAIQLEMMGKTESFEMEINAIAKEKHIATKGFETMAQQFEFFDGLSREKQAAMVMESIREAGNNSNELEKMQGIYSRNQLDSLYLLVKNSGGVLAEEEDRFLNQRNKNWIPQITSRLGGDQIFIAVGAAHLSGDNGVINLLRKEGYQLTPLKY